MSMYSEELTKFYHARRRQQDPGEKDVWQCARCKDIVEASSGGIIKHINIKQHSEMKSVCMAKDLVYICRACEEEWYKTEDDAFVEFLKEENGTQLLSTEQDRV